MKKSKSSPGTALFKKRGAGILLHVTSLPGAPYIGDIGTAAKSFADFLHHTKQSVWQMLPVHPTTASQAHSPYSSSSAMAGNPLLISLEEMVDEAPNAGDDNDNAHANFEKALQYKLPVLEKAWLQWKQTRRKEDEHIFNTFCNNNAFWLNDYALYTALKNHSHNLPWYEWPAPFRDRDNNTIREFEKNNSDEIEKIKWTQMVFEHQWQKLHSYCNERNIQLMGDLPMYVGHDSADVWSHKDIFSLNDDGSIAELAGVPPDIFNDEGQLWGMPTFKWNSLKASNFEWWVGRFRRNVELFDMLRLDHFRGFSAYWAVPGGDRSAKNGEWKPGPGRELFDAVKQSLGELALVAEDLGDIDEHVYALRDELGMPGMNVLQFAFSDDSMESIYLPHFHTSNSVVYSGTHDNNTTMGWFKTLKRKAKANLSGYTGKKITLKNVSEEVCRLAYQSVSNLAILPLQDVLSLDESARMNVPASTEGNWTWRMENGMLSDAVMKKLTKRVEMYGRSR